jgi:hypothetical protein
MAGQKSKNNLVEIPLEIVPETHQGAESPSQPADENVIEADIVQVNQGNVSQVNAGRVEFKQGGAGRVNAEQVTVHLGGIGMAWGTTVSVDQGGIGIVRAGEAQLDKCQTHVLVAQTATTKEGMTGVLVANEVHANPLRAVVVLAKTIDGQVETTLDTRGAILAGLVGGIALGLVSLTGRLLTRSKR